MLKIIAITLILAGQPVAEPETPTTSESSQTSTEPTEAKEVKTAEVPAQSSEDDVHILRSGVIGLLLRGGFFMWPILIMGIVASGVIIERYRSLKMLTTDSGRVRVQVKELLHADSVEKAIKLCDRAKGPAMDDYSSHIVAALERHLPILATVSSVAPMLGFLGTVHGMIIAFDDIVAKMGETNIVEAAAGGISVALLTTCFGLIVGIPAFMAFNYFTSVINRFVLQVEESATDLIETVTLQMALRRRRPPTPPVKHPQPPSKGTS